MKPDNLPFHSAFLRLSDSEKEKLLKAAEYWEAPAGARIFHPGDSGEELLLLLNGRMESDHGENSVQCWLPGDLWGEERLVKSGPLDSFLTAVETTRWLSWPGNTLRSLVSSSSGIRKSLSPLVDDKGILISGLSEMLPVSTGSRRHSRRVRPSMRPAAAGLLPAFSAAGLLYLASSLSEVLPEMLPLIAPAIYTGWLLVFLFKRITREYCIESDSITSRTFDWGRFSIESRHVPVDRIQGVETEKNGLYRHLLRIGNLVVKTSALDGVLILQDVNNPEDLRKELQEYQTRAVKRKKGREREELRRTLEGSGLGNKVPVKISSSELNQKTGKSGIDGIRFRKSLAFLSGRLLLPVLVSLIPILGFDVLSGLLHIPGRAILLLTMIPVLWALYRFEDWRNDSYQVTGGYVVDLYRKPLGLKESRRQVELASVQNIRTEQKGLIPFIFRFGNVILVTSGGAADTVFENVSRPWKVQEVLFRYREDELRRREVAMSEQRKDDFIRFSEALDQIRKPS